MLLSPSTGSANFAEAVELSGYLGSAQPWGKTVAAHAEQATRGWRFVTWAGSSAAAEPTASVKFTEPVAAINKGTTRDKVAMAAAEPTAYAKFAEPVEAIKKGTTRDKVAAASAAAEPTASGKFPEPVGAIKKGTCPGTCVPFRRHLRATALEH